MVIIIASSNQGKVKEFNSIILTSQAPLDIKFTTIKECCPDIVFDPEETGSSFQENAMIKAQAAVKILSENPTPSSLLPNPFVMSDDSGIEIEALDGRPGIYSARYLRNNGLTGLLTELGDNPNRKCRFVCHITLLNSQGKLVFETEQYWTGTITHAPRGKNGFGYDPIVIPDEYPNQTVAELSDEIKSQISHRAQALLACLPVMTSSIN
ncbi:MAG: RdgB/HAM1 family non-canonical purine NTP pyrophosphatase [Cyanobacteria bacterium]|nr:RdgB/HAM1 family non-canonical purine NTP pyrophosphatase [Cyanobacteriota bacterium]MDA1020454.1 RdgB/HAM1 family non-canonical purine NTP pyrophosphatase [Cyanobacteriota bacterium]